LALLPTKRIVPTTSTKIAASITAYSADVLADFVVPQFQGAAQTRLSGWSVFASEGKQMKRLEY